MFDVYECNVLMLDFDCVNFILDVRILYGCFLQPDVSVGLYTYYVEEKLFRKHVYKLVSNFFIET